MAHQSSPPAGVRGSKNAPAGPRALELALASIPVTSSVVLAGMPPEGLDVGGLLRDRGCSIRVFGEMDSVKHAWMSFGFPDFVEPDLGGTTDLVLILNAFSESVAPVGLLATLCNRFPGTTCYMVEEPPQFDQTGVHPRRLRRSITQAELDMQVTAAGSRVLRQLSATDRGYCWQLCLVAGHERAACPQDEFSPVLVRESQLLLQAYREAMGRLRREIDATEEAQLADVRKWQEELARLVRRERSAHLTGRRVRQIVGAFVRGLRGVPSGRP